ncbi:hypothetical protein [Alkaliphilus metalliredigens]|uniref:hypothetical protein n=1 Tax=Alkaliphilus metalliredigens TaxID=208226 RepID=UPI0012ED0C7F|nr:hypothetical protein [Alkaliphilus metalliredigens]
MREGTESLSLTMQRLCSNYVYIIESMTSVDICLDYEDRKSLTDKDIIRNDEPKDSSVRKVID